MGTLPETPIDYSLHPRVNSDDPVPPRPRPERPAHILKDDADAIRAARELAAELAKDAALRDREGLLPLRELDLYSQSGIWSINVPKEFGGPGLSYATLAKAVSIVASGDPAVAQIAQNHLAILGLIAIDATEAEKREIFGWALQGLRFGNAFSEFGGKTVVDFKTRVTFEGDEAVVNGEKFYTTGALLSHLVPIVSVGDDGAYLVFADRETPGLTITNNWSSFGQRTTASGSVRAVNVRVPKARAVKLQDVTAVPTVQGPISQIIQAAIDAGIARNAIDETIRFVTTQSRPWVDSGKETAGEDPYTIAAIGDLKIRLHAAEALLDIAGRAIDLGLSDPTLENVSEATIKTAEAKVLTTQIAIEATNKLFELSGTRSTLAQHALDRHWRNARTHTLHDPVRWKFYHVGNYYLNGVNPPRHAWN
ncbi:SfnB family sulfur acquisition oxidoreductase [Xinfangfangia sp. D13-10-4-6]|uniref:SfnB family sulfur acquisition oxidoreductase n=1 Tax=Pseudogemmobacter hezensis TaxID=2737662 RepID=UPI0015560888|nr:SfnB family sulfur acquisition oxidoreductase [Pseudogemmobacter hezensis]NPD16997.1 SfnB family sulfur acquisition oxidoreductase [Pseudogemmobacter hezensis]